MSDTENIRNLLLNSPGFEKCKSAFFNKNYPRPTGKEMNKLAVEINKKVQIVLETFSHEVISKEFPKKTIDASTLQRLFKFKEYFKEPDEDNLGRQKTLNIFRVYLGIY